MVNLIIIVLITVANWFIFEKMGRKGWEAIIPFYNFYVLCESLYNAGWKMLLALIPLYNIYFGFKVNIDLAHKFNQSTGFGIGLVLLPFVFYPILGFGNASCQVPYVAPVYNDDNYNF